MERDGLTSPAPGFLLAAFVNDAVALRAAVSIVEDWEMSPRESALDLVIALFRLFEEHLRTALPLARARPEDALATPAMRRDLTENSP